MSETIRTVLHLSPELVAALDAARGATPRSGFAEAALWKTHDVKRGAAEAAVANPGRLADKRGRYSRPVK